MSQITAPPPPSGAGAPTGLVRATVTSGVRRVDLVLPGAIPVAELVPELARSVGLLDAHTVSGGYRVVTGEGRILTVEAGLTAQGVGDGAVLMVTAGADIESPRIYDDVVEAMTDVVERDLAPWSPQAGRRTALGAAAVSMALGAAALLAERGSSVAAAAALIVTVALVCGSVVLSRSQDEDDVAVGVGWMAAVFGALTGLLFVDDALAADALIAAGAGAAVTATLAMLGMVHRRPLLLPAQIAGAVFVVVGLFMSWDFARPASILTAAMALLVLAGSIFPWLAMRFTGTDVDQIFSLADVTADPEDVDAARVRADARTAHEILIGVSGAVGVVLVLVAPAAVGLGVTGTLVTVLCCVVVMIRTRQYRTGTEVLVGLLSGLGGLAATAVAVLAVHPGWRPGAAVVLAVLGGVLLALTLVPQAPSVRRGRLGDVLETACLVSLLPVALVAIGVFSAISG